MSNVVRQDDSLFEFVCVLCNPMDRRSHMDLNNLTIPERTRVFEDLAGTSPIQNEDLFELVIAIKEMNQQLASRTSKNAFEIARKQNPEYTLDPGFFLMFLRANEYDPKRAAEMVVAHFEEKLILFGEEKLTKNIELSDLSEDDMYSLESGGFQVSRSKDKAGRNIAFFRKGDYRWKNIENWLRAFWYIWMVILQEEDAQLRGVVVVAFELGDKPPKFDFELVRREMHMLKCVPMRIVGSHFCTGTQALLQTLDLILHMATPFFRVHARSHCGIETEVLYQLMTFGIPPSSVPWVAGRSMQHERWIEERRRVESDVCWCVEEFDGVDDTHYLEDDICDDEVD